MKLAALNQANGRLKSSRVGVAIEQQGNRLALRAVFPPRPGSGKEVPYQQRIFLGCHANPAGVSFAEKEARKIGALLDCGQFSWEPYLKNPSKILETVGEWIERFSEFRHQNDPVAPVTWRTDYEQPFKKLPLDALLTPAILVSAIALTNPNTRQRRRYCLAYSQLAKFAGLELDVSPLIGTYSAQKVNPRDIPPDDSIAQLFAGIKNEQWRWVYGLLAVYGLRPHEVFFCDLDDFPIATVLRGKRGFRMVWPVWPEWADAWELSRINLPNCTGVEHSDFGERVSHFFQRQGLPFHAYDLRHAWARRAVEFGLDISLAAKQMGHSVAVHSSTYQAWLDKSVHQRIYDRLVQERRDRLD